MELIVERRVTSVGLTVIILLYAIIPASLSQTAMTSMEPVYYSDPATASANLTCQFSVEDGTYTFFNLEWRIDGSLVADFFGGAPGPTYTNYCLDSSDFAITKTDSKSDFNISSLDMTKNKQTFSCQVTFLKGGGTIGGLDSAALVVVVPTNTILMSNGSSSEAFTDGSEVELSLDVAKHIFQCVVAGINQNATFTWTVGVNQLEPDAVTENHAVDSGTGLTTSTSTATLTPNRGYNAHDLICKAVNYEGDPGVMFRLVLKVADPCVDVECKNGGTCVIDQNDPSMTECDCPVGYEGKLCETEPIGLSTGVKIGIGVVCACGFVIAVGCGIAIYKYNKTNAVTPEGQSKKGQSKKGKKKDADGETPENV